MVAQRFNSEAEQNEKLEALGTLEAKAQQHLVPYEYIPIVTALIFCIAIMDFHYDIDDVGSEDQTGLAEQMSLVFGALASGTSMISTIIFTSGLIRANQIFATRAEPQAAMHFLTNKATQQRLVLARAVFLISFFGLVGQESCRVIAFSAETTVVTNLIVAILVGSALISIACALTESAWCFSILEMSDYTQIEFFWKSERRPVDESTPLVKGD